MKKLRRKKVAIILAYLQNNLGDDLFVEHLCLRYPNVDFFVMENDFKNTTLSKLTNLFYSKKMKLFFKEYNKPVIPKKIKRFYKKFDACIMIGGSIFMQDNQYWRGKLRSFRNRASLNPNTYVLGANFGPFTDPNFLTEFTWAFTKVKDLCFRDSFSASFFPDSKKIRFAPDILFSYKYEKNPVDNNSVVISVINCAWGGRPAIQLNKLKKCADKYIAKITELCSVIAKKGVNIKLLSFCEKQGDLTISKMIESSCLMNGITNIDVCPYTGDVNEPLNIIANSKAVIATRFHAMILGFLFNKPVFPIIYDEKQSYVLQDLNFFGDSCLIERIDEINSNEIIDHLFSADSSNPCLLNDKISKTLKTEAEKQFTGLDKILKGVS